MGKVIRTLLLVVLVFYFSVYKDNIAIFDEDRLIAMLPRSVSELPKTAQRALREGIPFESWEEFTQLAQDYLS